MAGSRTSQVGTLSTASKSSGSVEIFEGIKTYGKGENFKDAAEGIMRFVKEANRRLQLRGISDYNPFSEQHWVLLCDEMTNWEANMPTVVMAALIEVCTQKLRQANMSVIFTSHGKTLTCFGGRSAGNGKFDVLKRQFTMMRCIAKLDPNVEGGKTFLANLLTKTVYF